MQNDQSKLLISNSPSSPQTLATQFSALRLNSSVPRFFLHLDFSFRRSRNIYLLHNNTIRFSNIDLTDFIDYLLKSTSSIIMANPMDLMGRILFRNPSVNYKYSGNSLYVGNGLKKLIGLFDQDQSKWMGSQSELLKFSYEIEKDFERSGLIMNKMLFSEEDSHYNNIKVIGPFYFPAESENIDLKKQGVPKGMEFPQKQDKIETTTKTPEKRLGNPLMNQTFDSSIFNNPSEKEAFNVSQLNTSRLLGMNMNNQGTSFGKYERMEVFNEEYVATEYTQPNVTSYNGQCPYFVNEKQYDAIIRRRRKKQKRMLLYGKSNIFI